MKSQHISIFYDHQASAMQKFGGISRYFDELIAHSNDLFYARKNRFVLRTTKYIVQKKLNIINEIHSYCLAQSADILHPTYYNPWVIRHARKPFVVTVHDMIYEIFPDIFPPIDETSRFKLWMMEHANHIIAISENTKKDILRIYPHLAGSKISVIHHGTSWHAIENQKKENFILFTGQRNGYKNFENFVKAASPLLIKYDLRLVCTGKPFDNAEMQFLKSLGILDRTSCLFASEAELKNLYATALLFVYPSLYEGFGIPILEAFAMNCPMAISNTSCFPEVAGDAALYFDPQSIDEMRSVMENAILSPSLRNELVLKGQERLKLYSWRKCAEETAKVYQKVLKKEIL